MEYEGKRCILKVGHHGHSNLVFSIQRCFNTAMLEKYDPKGYRTYIKGYIEAKEKLRSK